MDRVTTGVTRLATVRDMSVTPYCAVVRKYVYNGTSRNVISFVDTVFNVNRPMFTRRFLYLPKGRLRNLVHENSVETKPLRTADPGCFTEMSDRDVHDEHFVLWNMKEFACFPIHFLREHRVQRAGRKAT